jgi:hypothetical protein
MVRRVLLQLSLQEGWGPVGWASDWGKNIYAPTAFLGDAGDDEPRIFTVRTQFTAPDGSSVDKTWKVTVKYAATVDLGALNRYIQGADAEEDVPRSAIQVLEVVMRSGVSGEWGVCCDWLPCSASCVSCTFQNVCGAGGTHHERNCLVSLSSCMCLQPCKGMCCACMPVFTASNACDALALLRAAPARCCCCCCSA